MTASITLTAQSAAMPSLRPVDGDDAYMDGGAAPLWPIIQTTADRTEAHDAAVFNHLSWSGDFSVDPGGSNSTFTVRIGAINAVYLYNGTIYKSFAYAGGTISASKIAGGGNLANSAWYYVYACNSAGALDFEITTDAPTAARTASSGTNGSRKRYIGCFRTSTTGAPFPLRACHGRYAYRRGAIASVTGLFASDGLRGVDTTGTASVTSLDLSSRVPPHARLADVRGTVVAASTGTNGNARLRLYTAGDSTDASLDIYAVASAVSGDVGQNSESTLLETTSGQAIGYAVTKTTDAVAYSVDVMGWQE